MWAEAERGIWKQKGRLGLKEAAGDSLANGAEELRSRSVGDRNRTRAGWRVTGKLGGEKKSFDPALPSQESNLHCGDTGAAAWYAVHVACEVLSPATSRLVLHGMMGTSAPLS